MSEGFPSNYRGHPIELQNEVWVYSDTKKPVHKSRACGNCNKPCTSEGHDACLGTLGGGIMNACCGHGIINDAYVQFLGGFCVRGNDAKVIFNFDLSILKKWSNKERS